jgi:hypothetical protein
MPISLTAGGPARYRNMRAPQTFFNSTIFSRMSDQVFAERNRTVSQNGSDSVFPG